MTLAPKRPAHKAKPRPDMDEPVKVDEPFDEAVRRLLEPRQATKASDESERDSR
jgi:hypothetical protein